jgi:hypothetical protein
LGWGNPGYDWAPDLDFGFGWGLKKDAPIGDDIEVTLLIEGIKTK